MSNKSNVGRPAGRKKTSKIEVSLEPKVKEEFMQLIHDNGGNASVMIGQWINEYIKGNREEDKKWKLFHYLVELVD